MAPYVSICFIPNDISRSTSTQKYHSNSNSNSNDLDTCSTSSRTSVSSLHSSTSSASSPSVLSTSLRSRKSSRSTTPRSRTKLSFGVQTVYEIAVPSTEESQERWYDMHDYDQFREGADETLALVQACQRQKLDGHSTRGLEAMSRAGALRCKKQRKFAQQSVLKLQAKYFAKGLSNSQAVAEAYTKASAKSVAMALTQGEKDARECNQN